MLIQLNDNYFSDDDGKESIDLKDGEFMLSPDKMSERTTMYVTGSAGSGKSYFVAKYKTFKTNSIFLISENDNTEPPSNPINPTIPTIPTPANIVIQTL